MASGSSTRDQIELARLWTAHMIALTRAGLVYAEELTRHLGEPQNEGAEKNPLLRMAREMERSGFLSSMIDLSPQGSPRRLRSFTEAGGAMADAWFSMMERSLQFWERPTGNRDEDG